MKWTIIGVGLLLTAGCSVFGIRTAEEPAFSVIREQDSIQVRQYDAMLIAETIVDARNEKRSNIAFRRLADYIFGKNTKNSSISMTAPVIQKPQSEKIAMTAPVIQKQEADGWVMAFVLPAAYTMETIPKPLDQQVTLRQIPARKVASIRFRGSLDPDKVLQYASVLQSWLDKEGFKTLGLPSSAGYDPPWTLSFLRRNEVLIEVE